MQWQIAPVFQLVEATIVSWRPSWHGTWPLSRALVIGFTAFASFLIPDMEKMVALTGGVMFSFIGFILPGAFFLKLRPPAPGGRNVYPGGAYEVVLASLIITLGFVGGIFSVWSEVFAGKQEA